MTQISEQNIRTLIVDYVSENAIDSAASQINDQTNLLRLIDSFSFIEMIQFIEDSVGVTIDFSEADPEDLTNISGIVKYALQAEKS